MAWITECKAIYWLLSVIENMVAVAFGLRLFFIGGSDSLLSSEIRYEAFKRDEAPLIYNSPSPLKERGTQGVR